MAGAYTPRAFHGGGALATIRSPSIPSPSPKFPSSGEPHAYSHAHLDVGHPRWPRPATLSNRPRFTSGSFRRPFGMWPSPRLRRTSSNWPRSKAPALSPCSPRLTKLSRSTATGMSKVVKTDIKTKNGPASAASSSAAAEHARSRTDRRSRRTSFGPRRPHVGAFTTPWASHASKGPRRASVPTFAAGHRSSWMAIGRGVPGGRQLG